MIQKIKIENFKSHLNTNISLSNLTILAGKNGMGKSSLIQSLLLLRQSYLKNGLRGLELNADLCKIGEIQDAVTFSAGGDDEIKIELTSHPNQVLEFNFKFNSKNLDDTFIESRSKPNTEIENCNLFNRKFQYLSAFRTGSLEGYVKDTYLVEHLHQISQIEGKAELVAHYIDYFGNDTITIESLLHPKQTDKTLFKQIESWLREITPNINLHILKKGAEFQIEYSFNRENKTPTTKIKSKNTGFGVSYDLPLLAVILNAKPNDIIIIENPEAHIHPDGQAKLMELICKAAQAGVQFIIETHSDHIVNGALVATKKQLIDHKNVSMYFFERDEHKHFSIPVELSVSKTGRIKKPPMYFFDQINKDLETLMGF